MSHNKNVARERAATSVLKSKSRARRVNFALSANVKPQILVLGLLALGCTMDQPPQLRESAKALSSNGEQLILFQIEVPVPELRVRAYEFHSLVWRSSDNEDKKVITRSNFNLSSVRRRWVSDIYDLDAANGYAIIKVAEEEMPKDGKVKVQYSWREWDLHHNREISILHICDLPTDPFPHENGR